MTDTVRATFDIQRSTARKLHRYIEHMKKAGTEINMNLIFDRLLLSFLDEEEKGYSSKSTSKNNYRVILRGRT